jgi:hypothetical protein
VANGHREQTVSLVIPKKPDIGSLTVVSGSAKILATAEIILRCIGHSLDMLTSIPYRVPKAKE